MRTMIPVPQLGIRVSFGDVLGVEGLGPSPVAYFLAACLLVMQLMSYRMIGPFVPKVASARDPYELWYASSR